MEAKIFVKPVDGRRVKDPQTFELLPADGKRVSPTAYWLRRLFCGDVEKVINDNKEIKE